MKHASHAGIGTRLEYGEKPGIRIELPHCRHGVRHGGRVVGKIIEHEHAIFHTPDFLASPDAAKCFKPARDNIRRQAGPCGRGHGGQRITAIVRTRHFHAEAAKQPPVADHLETVVWKVLPVLTDLPHGRTVCPVHLDADISPGNKSPDGFIPVKCDEPCARIHPGKKFVKSRADMRQVVENIGVIELDRGNNGRIRRIVKKLGLFVEKGRVVFIAFQHGPPPAAGAVIGAEIAQDAADEKRRIHSPFEEQPRDHGGRGGLSVGARHHNGFPVLDQKPTDGLGHGAVRNPLSGNRGHFRVVPAHRVPDDNQVRSVSRIVR